MMFSQLSVYQDGGGWK